MIKLSYAVALPDCRSKKMQCYRGELDAICRELKALGYEGVELFARNPRELDQAAIEATLKRHGLAMPEMSSGPGSEDNLSLTDPDAAVRAAPVSGSRTTWTWRPAGAPRCTSDGSGGTFRRAPAPTRPGGRCKRASGRPLTTASREASASCWSPSAAFR